MHKKHKRFFNKYDKYLIVLIVLQVFGIIGGIARPVRIYVIFFMPVVVHYIFKKIKQHDINIRFDINLFSLWLLYGILSISWSLSKSAGIKEILYLALNILTYFTVLYFSTKSLNPTKSIRVGWVLLLILTIPVALIELFYNVHLSTNVHASDIILHSGGLTNIRTYASVTFGNLNAYSTMLCFLIPFLLGSILNNPPRKYAMIYWGTFIVTSFIILSNASKGAAIVLAGTVIIFVWYYFMNRGSSNVVLIVITTFTIIVYYLYISDTLQFIAGRIIGLRYIGDSRINFIVYGFDALKKSRLLGVGAGNFMDVMSSVYKLPVTSAHNLFLEIVVQYGVAIFFMFLIFLLKIYRLSKSHKNTVVRFIVVSSILMLPVSTAINSGYLAESGVWIFLGSLTVLSKSRI